MIILKTLKDDRCSEKTAPRCVIAKMNIVRRCESMFCNAEYVRRFANCVAVRGSQCDSLEVSENGETLNEAKGSRICDRTRSVKRERHVRHHASSKETVINR